MRFIYQLVVKKNYKISSQVIMNSDIIRRVLAILDISGHQGSSKFFSCTAHVYYVQALTLQKAVSFDTKYRRT
jgi:hypothetical protein